MTGVSILVTGSIPKTASPTGVTIVGRLGPYTSASKSPTPRAPIWSSVKARLTATVDFPTPPLQEETAMTWRTRESPPGRPSTSPFPPPLSPSPSTEGGTAREGCRGSELIDTETPPAPPATQGSSPTTRAASARNCSLIGQAGVVSRSSNETEDAPSLSAAKGGEGEIWSLLTKPHETMSCPKSGSMIEERAPRTSSTFGSSRS